MREWYMHPNGQIPSGEFDLDAVNPPVQAWAALRIYRRDGSQDRTFLQRAFHKLLLNFTWWVNRTDSNGRNVFAGGFLGMDNIGIFDRSDLTPEMGELRQADAAAWTAFFCLRMLQIAIELAHHDTAYEDVASKFFEHFVHLTAAIHRENDEGLWDERDGFYYDVLGKPEKSHALKVRSLVGLLPIIAVEILDREKHGHLKGFRKRIMWFRRNRLHLTSHLTIDEERHRMLLSLVNRERLERLLSVMLDEEEFLSPYGLRSLSRRHQQEPYRFDGHCISYEPGESRTDMFGGNSNWRGPIWFPINFLLIEALQRFYHYFGDEFQVEFPTGSGRKLNLLEVAATLQRRLISLFQPDRRGRRPVHDGETRYASDPHWRDLVLFYEHFHGDTGRGLGASHQTGWTALVASMLQHCPQCACSEAAPCQVEDEEAASARQPA